MLIYIIILVIIFYYLIIRIKNTEENDLDNIRIDAYREVNQFLNMIENYKEEYFTNSMREALKKEYSSLYYNFTEEKLKSVNSSRVNKFIQIYSNLDELVKKWNKGYIENELSNNSGLFSNIDNKSLDGQQRKAVVIDEDNNLILAGAGSGKTLTISAKVKYLVECKKIKPEEILLISFTKKAAEEMNERIYEKLGIQVKVTTFHKLGLDIISKNQGYRKDVAEELLSEVIEKYFKEQIYYDANILKDLIKFLGYYINVPKEVDSFANIGEYYKYCKSLDLTTLKGKEQVSQINKVEIQKLKKEQKTIKGEKVKSLEEVVIANFLYLHGVKYEYEREYPYKMEDKYRKKYRPDFYLSEYDIYIEHFGINKNKRAPHLSKIEEKKYLNDMKEKQNLHHEKGTKLIETYSYYYSEGILLEKLQNKLDLECVKLKEVDSKVVFKTIYENKEDKYFKELRKLIHTFITLFKSKGYKLQEFDTLLDKVLKIESKFLRERNQILLKIIKAIYIDYENALYKNNEIDFNDMINQSTEIVKNSNESLSYKYIIIDEYQDISVSRFNLIKEIKKQTSAKLICVGDDWQSIYRFTGSDIDLFTNFGEYVGYYETLKLERTYRNSQDLINIASEFILKNKKQIDKRLKSDKKKSNPINIINYKENKLLAFEKALKDIVSEHGDKAQITLLGRNNCDKNILSKDNTNGQYELKGNNDNVIVKSNKYPKLKINFFTVHKSKGLEADNIIILNLENKMAGFPNQIEYDPILDLVLTKSEKYPFAEERRLFYVALTRTKNKCYILVPEINSSIFADELMDDFKLLGQSVDIKGDLKLVKCPKCQAGNLIHREDDKRNYSFLSCSNYPICDFKTNYVEILDNPIKCKSCGGFMVKRQWNGEDILGCTNYPYCKNKEIYEENKEKIDYSQDEIIEEYYQTLEEKDNGTYYEIYDKYAEIELNSIIDEEAKLYEDEIINKDSEDNQYIYMDNIEWDSSEIYYNNFTYEEGIEKKIVNIYVKKYKSNYIFDKTCISDIDFFTGDIIRDYNKYLVIKNLQNNIIFVEEIKNVSDLKVNNKILTLYVDGEYYKKCITDANYEVGDIFECNGRDFEITNIFKDTIFMKNCEEINIEEDRVDRLELEDYRVKKVKEQLFMLRDHSNIDDTFRLWIKGFVHYLEDNYIIDLFSDNELINIIYYDMYIDENDLLESIDYLKLIDIRGYRIELTDAEESLINKVTIDKVKIWEINNKIENLNKYNIDYLEKQLWMEGLIKSIEKKDLCIEFTAKQLENIIFIDEKIFIDGLKYVATKDVQEYKNELSNIIYGLSEKDAY